MYRFEPFTAQHLITVAGLAAAIVVMCVVGRRLRGTTAGRRYELGLAVSVGMLWIGYQAYDLATRGFDPGHSLPLQLSDLTALIAALGFARPSRTTHALAWFWGVALGSQAIITPDLTRGPTTVSFWAFWLYHLFIVGAGVYAIVVRQFRPEWKDLKLAVGLGVLYAVVMFTIDAVFGLNYGYLGRSMPGQPTLIDVLGPWPLRVVYIVLLGAVAMFLLWVPWASVRRITRRR
jgi:hypothetical integral membrane protein (TIGR02206 family)